MKSGEPQGSVLGSSLYILFTHDFPSLLFITLAKFSDVYSVKPRQVRRPHFTSKIFHREDSCADWRVSVNPSKWKLVQFTYFRYTDQEHIPTSSSFKYLGVTLDSKMTWDLYIRNTVQKSRKRFYEFRHIACRQSKTRTHLKRLMHNKYIRTVW